VSEGVTTVPRPKLIYVMGAGHSGSTILGVALGNCGGFFYAGEIEEWLVKSGAPSWADAPRREFWSRVGARVDGSRLFGPGAARAIERSSSLLRPDRLRERRALRRPYRQVSEALLRAIAEVSGCGQIVDTSHFPLRARELSRLAGVEVYIVFLVRDAQAVVDSNLRELRPHEVAERRLRTLAMIANLALTLAVSAVVFLRHPRSRRLFLRHEQFIADPSAALRAILEMAGSEAPLPDLSALRVGAPIEGNRLIRSETIAIERRPEQAPNGPASARLLQAICEPLLARMHPALGDGVAAEAA
jgi:hypothetical protein